MWFNLGKVANYKFWGLIPNVIWYHIGRYCWTFCRILPRYHLTAWIAGRAGWDQCARPLVGSVNKSIDIKSESILIYICLMSVDVNNVLVQWLQGFCYNIFRLAIVVLKVLSYFVKLGVHSIQILVNPFFPTGFASQGFSIRVLQFG
jgi:hypothetical protein